MSEGGSTSSPSHSLKKGSEAAAAAAGTSTGTPRRISFLRTVVWAILVILLLAGITALVLYLVYRPSKPRFHAISAAVFNLNTTATAISAFMQFTLLSRNPNSRSSIYYDSLRVYAAYRGHPVTPPVAMPPLYQRRKSTVAMTALVGELGKYVAAPTEVVGGLVAEEGVGSLVLSVVVMGRLKYKSGPFRSPSYGMFVICDVVLPYSGGGTAGGQLPLLPPPNCHVDV